MDKTKKRKIYLDYAATTPVDPEVQKAMRPYFSRDFGNASSLHHFGQKAKEALEQSRDVIAKTIGAESEEIIFTSSATESANLALKGITFANRDKGNHIIISSIEHDCVLNTALWLKKQGFEITQIPVDKYGLVDPKEVEKAVKKETVLVSVIWANNEIGTIQPIAEIGKICRKNNVYFHTDAAQAFGKVPINVVGTDVDLLTASAHKIYGPKGAAFLFVRKGVNIDPILHGGGQEFGLRSSTENLPAIVGFAKATEITSREMKSENKRLLKLQDWIITQLLKKVPDSYLNGHSEKRVPNITNLRFAFVEGESIMMELDWYGIAVSTGSACSSPKLEPSHVLLALGLRPEEIHGSIRISLGRWTTKEEVDYLIEVLPKVVSKLRKISPFAS
ncbi:cysteine desulfurase NifS [Candidatus Curtissbacteria bacterium RBG_16_39_7]|uniref:Cysteine desulfurase IscS n=1 Tax=Candidatus Curtissbacteria bacterium RBG_16_39_7 TaxID=1797707 RepID=A0A1F5G1E3_9BACT|nr:MAG: cysteine desulfurase NifS [Candidatus Curtissbacteria bacterium RBG_16_39_7]